ncbi:hypothetical protein ACEPPN_016592 [Leptodophora sp. 'Broadleaf-Isolate-01']
MENHFLESTVVLRDDASYHRVVAVGPHFIVKHGHGVREREGQTLLFLEKHLASSSFITVPKLYAMYRMPSNGHLCLIMERLDGESLETMWPVLDNDEKSTVCGKLKDVFAAIFRIPMPYPNFYGSVERGPVPHHLFHSADGDKAICGPFGSEKEFNAALVRRLRAIWAANGEHSFKADFYERNLNAILKGHEPRFSHSDLQPKNILVRRVQSQAGLASERFEVALIRIPRVILTLLPKELAIGFALDSLVFTVNKYTSRFYTSLLFQLRASDRKQTAVLYLIWPITTGYSYESQRNATVLDTQYLK